MNLVQTEVAFKMGREFCWFTFDTAESAKSFKYWVMNEVGFSHWSISRRQNVVYVDSAGFQVGRKWGSY